MPCGCLSLARVNPSNADALAGSFYKRHAISPCLLMQEWPLTAGEYAVSGSVSSPSRGAFHLSLTVLVHYRSLKMLSLGGWSPQLPTRFLVPRGTQDASPAPALARYGSLTLSGGAFQHLRVRAWALLLVLQPQPLRKAAGLGSSRFARHYYGNLVLISSRRATEMFQFTRCPPPHLCVQ